MSSVSKSNPVNQSAITAAPVRAARTFAVDAGTPADGRARPWRVLFVTLHLSNSMRLLADYLRHLDPSFEASLLVLEQDVRFASEFPPDIPVQVLNRGMSMSRAPSTLWRVFREARRHDLVVCMAELSPTYMCAVAAMLARRPCIAWVHTNISRVFELGLRPGKVHRPFVKALYPRLHAVVGVSQGVVDDLRDDMHLRNAVTIVNGIDIERVRKLANEPIPPQLLSVFSEPVVVCAAALTPQKNHEVLIEAHAIVRNRGIRYRLLLLGDGELRGDIQKLAEERGVADSVFFGGYVDNPYPMLKQARVFALTSRFEGHALVVAESLALGVPVVSTDCRSGPGEILDGGRYGELVPVGDSAAFADKLQLLLTDETRRAQLAELANEGAERQRIQTRVAQMESLFREALGAAQPN